MTAPVIHVQPTTQTVYEGQQCKFRVVAGGTSLTYQWEKSDNSGGSWADVSGATSLSYTTAATVRSTDNADQYRCKVTSGGDTTTSDAAIMTVWNPSALGSDLVYWFNPATDCYQERTGSGATTPSVNGGVVGTMRGVNGAGSNVNGTCSADSKRGILRLTGIHGTPGVELDGVDDVYNFTTDLAGAFNGKSYGYIFMAAVMTLESVVTHDPIIFYNNASSARISLRFNNNGTAGRIGGTGRRLDADTAVELNVDSAFIDNETLIAGLEVEWANADLHVRKNFTRIATNTSWQTAGAVSSTNSGSVYIGASTDAGNNNFDGIMGHLVVCAPTAAFSSDTIALIEGFIASKSGMPTIDWALNARVAGTLTTATVKATTIAQAPSGAAITEGALTSWRYRHPNQICYHFGKLHIGYDSSGTNEQGAGGKAHYQYSSDKGVTWSSPVELIPSQSAWTAAADTYQAGTHITTSRRWVPIDGRLFYTACVILCDGVVLHDNGITCVAVAAVEVFSDGTRGTPFRITPEDYTALDGKTKLNYDATLGPRIYAIANPFGRYGGTATGYTGVALDGIQYQDSVAFFEKHVARKSDTDPDLLIKTIRDLTNGTTISYVAESTDGGATWGRVRRTNVPCSPSPLEIIRLVNGKYAIIGSMNTAGGAFRNELFLGILNGTTRLTESANYIRTGITETPDYAGTSKLGGASYASAVQVGNYLHVLYSTQKEEMVHSRVLIPGATDAGNDSNSIAITSPTLSDTRTTGSAANITATETGTSGNVDILLSLDGGLTFPVTLASNTTLPYSWNPTFGHVTTDAVLRIRDTADTNVFGDSLEFQVEAGAGGGGSGGSAANLLLMGVG